MFLVAGGVARFTSLGPAIGATIWMVGLVVTGAPVVWRTTKGILAGRFAADLVASLAIVAAASLREPLAGLVIVLMQTGGAELILV